jgi:crossover junction endodeoxyribonuclease RusA
VIFTLPWPPAKLSPNARLSPFEKARAVKAYRSGCSWEATAAGLRKIEPGPLHLTISFAPPDARRRDLDNMLAALKPGLDGLSDVLGVDDHLWALTITRAAPVKRGAVSITIARPVEAEAATIPFKGSVS